MPLVLPLIDFERAEDQAALDAALDKLESGFFDWLVISSITTLRVLMEKADARGTAVSDLVPPATRVATIGPSSKKVLEAAGLVVSLAPTDVQSAEGLLALWQPSGERVLLPQADIAAPALREGLRAKGALLTVVTAYNTVDYPARDERKLTAEAPSAVEPSDAWTPQELEPAAAKAAILDGGLDAIVAASPSAARRIAATLQPLGSCSLVAIGRPTAAEATRLGLPVAAVAKEPTPDGIATALESVFANEGNIQ
ncbi:uroporphyrinogen-III synthase [Paenarthrobacter sp. S56]|uniref:uroporphyrinogen-III synthase n=1 Tax=Paenarthrobacter sp. S56 TaxID=3138179 RepID=UPI00321BA5EB